MRLTVSVREAPGQSEREPAGRTGKDAAIIAPNLARCRLNRGAKGVRAVLGGMLRFRVAGA
jgi:hypothetical protein